jgi:hypothetical protein
VLLYEACEIVLQLAESKTSEHEGIPKQRQLEAIEIIKEILLSATTINEVKL